MKTGMKVLILTAVLFVCCALFAEGETWICPSCKAEASGESMSEDPAADPEHDDYGMLPDEQQEWVDALILWASDCTDPQSVEIRKIYRDQGDFPVILYVYISLVYPDESGALTEGMVVIVGRQAYEQKSFPAGAKEETDADIGLLNRAYFQKCNEPGYVRALRYEIIGKEKIEKQERKIRHLRC